MNIEAKFNDLSPTRRFNVQRFQSAVELVVNTPGGEHQPFSAIMAKADSILASDFSRIAYPHRCVK